jgi:hypothetical protein
MPCSRYTFDRVLRILYRVRTATIVYFYCCSLEQCLGNKVTTFTIYIDKIVFWKVLSVFLNALTDQGICQ